MDFWASTESDKSVYPIISELRRTVEPHLNAVLDASLLSSLDAKIRYVPIVMPPEAQARYPARSRLRKKERLYDCAPQLDYEVFLTGDRNSQLKCYLDGLRECASRLPELGASALQAEEFLRLLDQVYEGLRD